MADLKELRLADNYKKKLTRQAMKQTRKLYRDLYIRTKRELQAMLGAGLKGSEKLQYQALKDYQKTLGQEIDRLTREINRNIKVYGAAQSESGVKAIKAFMSKVGMPNMDRAFRGLPTQVVQRVLNEKVYNSKQPFSKSIWGTGAKMKKDIHTIIAEGIANNKSTLSISRDLEKYVNPSAKKPWDWNKVYPNVSTKVDYNAQRLARTMIQHSFQYTLRETLEPNPFAEALKWHSAHSVRTCQICLDRELANDYGLGEGLYPIGEEPLDHPNGLCWFTAEIPPLSEVSNRISDWKMGGGDAALDNYAEVVSQRYSDFVI